MRSARSRRRFVLFVLALAVFVLPAFAAEESSRNGKISSEIEGINERLESVERTQADILIQQDKILGEIDRVRVWSRHSGG